MTTQFLKDIKPFFYRRRMVYVDVGAHQGLVFRQVVKAGLKVREAHLVEPNPRTFARLQAAVADVGAVKLCTCHNLALGAEPGRLRMRDADSMTKVIAAEAVPGSAVPGSAEAVPGFAEAPAGTPLPSFVVEATTLDALSEGFERRHISLLKIDVEGYESAVLAGASGLLADQAIDMIYIEAGIDPENSQQTYYRAVEDLLAAHGYRLFRVYEQMHEWIEDSPLLRRINMAFMSERFATQNPFRLSSELFELHEKHAALESSHSGLGAELATVRAGLAAARDRLAATRAELEAARAELATARDELAAARAAARDADAAGRKAVGGLEREMQELKSYGSRLERQHARLLRSTSWRATEPVRRLVRLVGGRTAPAAFQPRLEETAPGRSGGKSGGKSAGKSGNKASGNKASGASGSAASGPAAGPSAAGGYVRKLSNKLQSTASVATGGEYLPFDVLKPATRTPAAAPGERFVFAITLASSRTVPDWAHTERLLGQTLRSVIGQTDPDWTAIIAGHERPDLPELDDDRVEFVSIHRKPPAEKSQFRGDKSAKRHVLGRRLAEMGGGYFMQLDADDLVRDDFVATVRGKGYGNGAVAATGYALDFLNHRLAPVPGVWRHPLNHVCGSCSAVRYTVADLPTRTHRNNDSGLVFNMTRQHAYTSVAMEELGRPLEVFDAPMIVYLVNHAQNLSFSLQKAGDRGRTIIEAVEKHALPTDEARAILQRFGAPNFG